MNKFISLFIIFLLSFPLFSSNYSLLIGDITKEELFSSNTTFHKNYLSYQVNELEMQVDQEGLSIKILFGTWCHDSQREVPKILKLLDEINFQSNMISLIGLNYQKNEPLNRARIFNVKKTPTIIFFRHEKEIGRIVETPDLTMEESAIAILKVINSIS